MAEMQRIRFDPPVFRSYKKDGRLVIRRVKEPKIPKFCDGVLTIRLKKTKESESYPWHIMRKGKNLTLYASGDDNLVPAIRNIVTHAAMLVRMQPPDLSAYK